MGKSLVKLIISAGTLFLLETTLTAQCRPGWLLIGEDDQYWYCSSPARRSDVSEVLEKQNPELLGDQWRFRKAVIEAVGSLAEAGLPYKWGGKLRVSAAGGVTYICVAESCGGESGLGIDCSGTAAYGELSACFIKGFFYAMGRMRGLESNAAGQAEYFKRQNAFRSRYATPLAGDLIFFRNTARNRNGITHVAIYLGTTRDGRTGDSARVLTSRSRNIRQLEYGSGQKDRGLRRQLPAAPVGVSMTSRAGDSKQLGIGDISLGKRSPAPHRGETP